jgi:hypothetical protein
MVFDKWRTGEKGNREFGWLLFEIQDAISGLPFNRFLTIKIARIQMRCIDLIDWTSAWNQPRFDYAKPLANLPILLSPGFQISLDALPSCNP